LFSFRDCPEKFEALKMVSWSGRDAGANGSGRPDITPSTLRGRALQDIAQAKDYLAKKGYRQPAQ
jgi:hypothetical protein